MRILRFWAPGLFLAFLALALPLRAAEIHDAARSGNIAEVERLLKPWPNRINAVEKETGLTPLHIAVLRGDQNLVAFLLAKGVDTDLWDSALRMAIWNGQRGIIELLLAEGARVKPDMLDAAMNAHLCDEQALTDPSYRMKLLDNSPENSRARLEMAQLLLGKGARAEYRQPLTGEAPLMFAAYWGKEMVELLLENRADVQATDIENRASVLHYAANVTGDKEIFRLLIAQGIAVHQTDRFGNTPLHWAVRFGNLSGVISLLAVGADPNVLNAAGFSPLHHAAGRESPEIVTALLKSGAQVNAATGFGWTPLYVAARAGRAEIAELLMQNGAEVNAADLDGKTPLKIARRQEHEAVAAVLEKHGASETPEPCAGDDCAAEKEKRARREAFFSLPPEYPQQIRVQTASGQYTYEIEDDMFAIVIGYDLENGDTSETCRFSAGAHGNNDKPVSVPPGKKVFLILQNLRDSQQLETGLFHLALHEALDDYSLGHRNRILWGPSGLADLNSPEKKYARSLLERILLP